MRRRWYVAAGVLAGLGVAAGVVRWVWLPAYRPSLRAGETYGVDVSHHQGHVDWQRVARDGISFAYLKATEGRDHVDTRFVENAAGARAAGLRVGAYHFFTLCSPGAEQAAHFAAVARDASGPHDLPAALDLELAGNCRARPGRDDVLREVTAFRDAVERVTGRPLVFYVGDDFARRYPGTNGDEWVRQPLRRPGGDWSVWQASSWARVDGIDGGADLDVGRFR